MKEAKIMPIDVLQSRLAQLTKEKEELEFELEEDIREVKERREDGSLEDGLEDYIREDQKFWLTEIYKLEFCIDEIDRIIKMIK